MKNISNIDEIPKEYMDDPDFKTRMKTILIGDAVGSEKIYVNMDFVKPGGVSVKYHSHSKQEEFYLIMDGKGVLRINGEEIPIKKGDVISAPAGKDAGHQFINNSEEMLQILDVGTREKDDIVTYPDENTLLIKSKKLVFNINDNIKGWTSEPNE
ncbi:MAG TPA: cupin domain-containing protein [Clostridia bacterium]|nr:cupin domain-containing protein [Clostridia bacterium]